METSPVRRRKRSTSGLREPQTPHIFMDAQALGEGIGSTLAAVFSEQRFEMIGIALAKAMAGQKQEKSVAERFPKRDIFSDIFRLPRALQEYKEWCAEKRVKDAEAITDLKLLLPQQLRDYRASGVPSSPITTWEEAERTLLAEAASYLGEASIQEKMDAVTYNPTQRVSDLWAELVCLASLKNTANQDQDTITGMDEWR